MRISIVSDRYAPEARAAAVLATSLAGGLVRRGHEVCVWCRRPTQYVPGEEAIPKRELRDGVEVRRIGALTSSAGIAARLLDQMAVSVGLLLALLRAPAPDVWFVYSPPLLLTVPVLLAALWHRRPVVLNLHDLYPQAAVDLGVMRNRFVIEVASRVERWLYRAASRILVAAPSSLRILGERHGVAPEKMEMLWNWAAASPYSDAPRDNEFRQKYQLGESFVVLYAGLMGRAQDLDVVLDVAESLDGKRAWKFVLVGDGPRAEELRRRSARLSNVVFTGPVDPQMYNLAVRAADVCLAPLSRQFRAPAVPGKISTVMACGRPLVASVAADNDTVRLLEESQAGLATPAGDILALQAALERLDKSPDLRDQMSRNGRAWAARHFTPEAALTTCEEVLASACKQPTAPQREGRNTGWSPSSS